MGVYRVAEVCPNGHVTTSRADARPEQREPFCSRCGEATLTSCDCCAASIRGHYQVDGVIGGLAYEPPAYCYNCGAAFPWTQRKIDGAMELLELDTVLSHAELLQMRTDLVELTKDTPKLQAASLRFKKAMSKAGVGVATGVREIVIDVLSEAAKKAIWS